MDTILKPNKSGMVNDVIHTFANAATVQSESKHDVQNLDTVMASDIIHLVVRNIIFEANLMFQNTNYGHHCMNQIIPYNE